ncbi:MAG TPA: VOC family protein [Chloroflexota bacterium]|nr:VOC family protein [Chloroflexota bacterium]
MVCRDPDQMREYYQRWFGFDELARASEGSIFLSDGHLNIALLRHGSPLAPGAEPGLHHIGFHVESLDEVEQRLGEYDPALRLEKRPPEDPYSQYRINVSGGLAVDVSDRGYGVDGAKRVPGIRHIAHGEPDVEGKLRFYAGMFQMSEVEVNVGREEGGGRNRGCVADGFVNICLVRPREGADHFGVLIPEPVAVLEQMKDAYPDRPELWQVTRPGVEAHILDIERNNLSLSAARGWEVAPGLWDRLG